MDYQPRDIGALATGEWVEVLVAVTEYSLRPLASKPGKFLSLVLQDRTGVVPAVMWEGFEAQVGNFGDMPILHAWGQVQDYRGKPQLKLDRIEVVSPDKVNASWFLPSLPDERIEALWARLVELIASVSEPNLKALLTGWLIEDEAFARRFKEGPGARRMHHAYLGGLLEHTVTVCEMAEGVITAHPEFDRDLLLTGVIIHDVGKLVEYKWDIAIGTTDEGELIGHTVIGYRMLLERLARLEDFPRQLSLRLQHLILSHHGERDYGAPILPKTPEALAVHYLENLDAKANQFETLRQKAAETGAEWSEYEPALERRIWAPLPDEEPEIE